LGFVQARINQLHASALGCAIDAPQHPSPKTQPVLAHYRAYAPPPAASARLAAYVEAARAHPAVAATMVHPQGRDYAPALIEARRVRAFVPSALSLHAMVAGRVVGSGTLQSNTA
jgi:hypothetical protein